jgi:glycosyltransferase involved in cell wall biosynthesis
MKISVVIPIHNEQDNINQLYGDLTAVLVPMDESFEIIMVNDGSKDQSGSMMDDIAEKDRRLKVVHLSGNHGQAYAMWAGFDHASGDTVIAMDGDNQNDPEDIPRLLEKIDSGFDVVSGWRKQRKDGRLFRILPSKAANWLISKVTGIKLHDFGCSLKAYKKETIQGLKLYGDMHRFIPILTSWRGACVGEIEVNHRYRRFGSSHYGLSRIIKVLLDLLFLRFWDRHLRHPVHLFGLMGLLSIAAGIGSFGLMFYYKFWKNISFISTPLPTLSVLFLLVGVMAILMGIVTEILMRTYYESQQKSPYKISRVKN